MACLFSDYYNPVPGSAARLFTSFCRAIAPLRFKARNGVLLFSWKLSAGSSIPVDVKITKVKAGPARAALVGQKYVPLQGTKVVDGPFPRSAPGEAALTYPLAWNNAFTSSLSGPLLGHDRLVLPPLLSSILIHSSTFHSQEAQVGLQVIG